MRLNAEILMMTGGILAFLLTVWQVRNRDLREKYAVSWILASLCLLTCGLFPELLKNLAEATHLSYPAAVLFLALGAIYLFGFSVSLSLTRQYRRSIRLMQELAIQEARLRRLERSTPGSFVHEGVS